MAVDSTTALSDLALPTPRLRLENYGALRGLTVALAFFPSAWRAISQRQINPSYTFHIFDRRGHAIGISGSELLYPTTAADLRLLEQPILRLEDRRFYGHRGIDFWGVLRATVANIKARSWVQGASTITQQLVRNALLSPHRSILRKALEVLLAWKCERHYSKEEILRLYSEVVYMGHGARGFVSASKTFFRKPLCRLSEANIAGLLGLLRSPARFSPINHWTEFLRRSSFVQTITGLGDLCVQQSAPVINPIQPRRLCKPRLATLIRHDLFANGITSSPARVGTTLDSTLQSKLDTILRRASKAKSVSHCAAIVVSNANLDVLAEAAWSNGTEQEFSPSYFGALQPGSTFKTFTLLAAIEHGIPLDHVLESSPYTSRKFSARPGQPWQVRNYGHVYRGKIPLLEAFRVSDNTAFARLLELLDIDRVYETYKRFALCDSRSASPAIVLGGIARGISLRRLVEAYSCIARDRQLQRVSIATHVELYDKSGTYIAARKEGQQLIEPWVCEYLRLALREAGRTIGGKLVSGKTGTTSRGNIFVGYTEEVSMAVWVGFRRAIPEYQRKTGAAVRLLDEVADYLFGPTGASLKI